MKFGPHNNFPLYWTFGVEAPLLPPSCLACRRWAIDNVAMPNSPPCTPLMQDVIQDPEVNNRRAPRPSVANRKPSNFLPWTSKDLDPSWPHTQPDCSTSLCSPFLCVFRLPYHPKPSIPLQWVSKHAINTSSMEALQAADSAAANLTQQVTGEETVPRSAG